jgi:hypothetical protein
MLLQDIIIEIKDIKRDFTHKAAFDIYSLLNNNKQLFLRHLNVSDVSFLINTFEKLTYASPKEYYTVGYEREFETAYNLLLFYLQKII